HRADGRCGYGHHRGERRTRESGHAVFAEIDDVRPRRQSCSSAGRQRRAEVTASTPIAPGDPPRTQRRRTRRRLILRTLLAIIVFGPLLGWLYEQYAVRRDTRRFPPPGQFARVEPVRRLHYVCSGSGGPLVLFEVSGFSNSMSFREARAGLAQRTRVCSYDRAGIGWSDRASSPIPVSM